MKKICEYTFEFNITRNNHPIDAMLKWALQIDQKLDWCHNAPWSIISKLHFMIFSIMCNFIINLWMIFSCNAATCSQFRLQLKYRPFPLLSYNFECKLSKGPFTRCGNGCGNGATINWIPLYQMDLFKLVQLRQRCHKVWQVNGFQPYSLRQWLRQKPLRHRCHTVWTSLNKHWYPCRERHKVM